MKTRSIRIPGRSGLISFTFRARAFTFRALSFTFRARSFTFRALSFAFRARGRDCREFKFTNKWPYNLHIQRTFGAASVASRLVSSDTYSDSSDSSDSDASSLSCPVDGGETTDTRYEIIRNSPPGRRGRPSFPEGHVPIVAYCDERSIRLQVWVCYEIRGELVRSTLGNGTV